jgi:acyl-CoA reductase-like NAD-dependent aldehyde dehydrogenase
MAQIVELLSTSAHSMVIIDLTNHSIINPTNGKVITKVSEGTRQDVDKAVAAAQKAYDTVWGLKVGGPRCNPSCHIHFYASV